MDPKTGPDLSVVLKVGFGGRRPLWLVHSCSTLRAGKQASTTRMDGIVVAFGKMPWVELREGLK